ncbi:DNA cytosine methyltransferase [Comamonas terrigena]|uniref:DNA cytosine methyltransferase n=1 Tax=Comamonas terrigena TaxID=32013 RepID=UPI00289D14CC|nr:DNA cytosine methyltransferase [Comamonas terrigena]
MKAIDLFAGAGGFSTGATMAGVQVVWAANHWPLAVQYHAVNHPDAAHLCQDLHQADWSQVPSSDILLAAPCCQGHSKARGKAKGNPQHDASRSTAWAVVSAAECLRPQSIVVENVPEFLEWDLFPAWELAMQKLGYTLAPHIVDAADHGVPQHRVRMFLVATKSRAPLVLDLPKREHTPASAFLDFDSGSWSPIHKPRRSRATLARVAAGRAAHGDRFLAPYYGSGSGTTGRSLRRPIGTVTTKARWALIDGDRMRMLTVPENCAAMGFPKDYQLPSQAHQAIHMLGNAVCPPVARDVIAALMNQI